MKKYILLIALFGVCCNRVHASENRGLPAGWLPIHDDVMSPEELREYDQYRQDKVLIGKDQKKSDLQEAANEEQLHDVRLSDDEIGKKALVQLLPKSQESFQQIVLRFLVAVLRK